MFRLVRSWTYLQTQRAIGCKKDNELLGVKKAQFVAFQFQAFQKSRCFANIAHCWFENLVVKFTAGMVLVVGALIDVDVQISKYNFGSLGKTSSSSSMALDFQS